MRRLSNSQAANLEDLSHFGPIILTRSMVNQQRPGQLLNTNQPNLSNSEAASSRYTCVFYLTKACIIDKQSVVYLASLFPSYQHKTYFYHGNAQVFNIGQRVSPFFVYIA